MGLKDWFAKVSGPKGYGTAIGKPTVEGGLSLANSVFMSHGTDKETGSAVIFDTEDDMKAADFAPRFGAITKIDFPSLTLEEKLLFKNLQAAMISFAYILTSNGARQYMRQETFSMFNKGLVPSLSQSMVQCGLLGSVEAVRAALDPYLASSDAARQPMILNMERAASGDALENLIITAVKLCGEKPRYGFVRTGTVSAGTIGFGVIAVSLVEETLKSIFAATKEYNW